MKNRPDAIFSAGDRLTISCLNALKDKRIPHPGRHRPGGLLQLTAGGIAEPGLIGGETAGLRNGTGSHRTAHPAHRKQRPVTEFEKVVLQTELFTRDSSAARTTEKKRKKAVNDPLL